MAEARRGSSSSDNVDDADSGARGAGAIHSAWLYHDAQAGGEDGTGVQSYGRVAPLPYPCRGWPTNARLDWPSLRFAERSIVLSELRDVWISGNDGVVSDGRCNVYLPSHGFQIPLHLNLPADRVGERLADSSVRVVGFDDRGELADRGGDVLVLSALQIFSANFYSFSRRRPRPPRRRHGRSSRQG